jgi:hypothetical protein
MDSPHRFLGPIHSIIFSAAALRLRFRHPLTLREQRGTLMYQIYGSNVFDQRGIASSRVDFVDPRSIRLTTTFAF